MITLIGLFPLLFSFITLFLFKSADITPDWYVFESNYIDFFSVAIVSFLFFVLFYQEEYDIYARRLTKTSTLNQNYLILAVLTSFGLLANFFFKYSLDLRVLFQSANLNIVYSSIPTFIFLFFSKEKKYKHTNLLLIMLSSLFFVLSGSKASLLSILLLTYFSAAKEGITLKKVIVFCIILTFLFYSLPLIFNRYLDTGLSMLNAISACKISSSLLISKYLEVISNFITSGNAFPPILYFYTEVGVAPYNITPTVIGDILCGNIFFNLLVLLILLIYFKISLKTSKKIFGISSGFHEFHVFMLVMTMTSNSFDIVKFEIIYWFFALLLGYKFYAKKYIRLGL
jgi:hypothetical protein